MTQKSKKPQLLPNKFHQLFDALADKQEFLARAAYAALSDAEKTRAEDILTFKKAAYERAVVLGPSVWKNWDFVKDVFFWSPREPNMTVLAALSHPKGRTFAIGQSLLTRVARYSLLVSFRSMTLDAEALDKLLKHELLHMGYPHHNADFRKVCRAVGGVIADDSITGGGDPYNYFEQRQSNGRYKKASPDFATEELAHAWFNDITQREARKAQAIQWLAANPGKGMREVQTALMWRLVMS